MHVPREGKGIDVGLEGPFLVPQHRIDWEPVVFVVVVVLRSLLGVVLVVLLGSKDRDRFAVIDEVESPDALVQESGQKPVEGIPEKDGLFARPVVGGLKLEALVEIGFLDRFLCFCCVVVVAVVAVVAVCCVCTVVLPVVIVVVVALELLPVFRPALFVHAELQSMGGRRRRRRFSPDTLELQVVKFPPQAVSWPDGVPEEGPEPPRPGVVVSCSGGVPGLLGLV
mmetsp:Transcript_21737/g.48755  ORF Transcript_21737/g.48755 Transcript_21737/m.48755 type:complete len:225 (+) Transcript_21737:1425-2099(+)